MSDPRNHLTDEQLDEFARMLRDKHREITGDLSGVTSEMKDVNQPGPGAAPSDAATHHADEAMDERQQARDAQLAEHERTLVREIEQALQRIEQGTCYGVCQETGRPISVERLRAKPWARYCKEYAEREQG